MFCDHCGAENKDDATLCFACHQPLDSGSQAIEDPSSAMGTLLNHRYQILKQVGAGGFGAIYQARDTRLHNRIVAVKEIHLRGLTRQEEHDAVASFHSEVELLASLNHPGLPTIFEEFEEQGNRYLVMDFIEGETLEEYVTHSGGKLACSEALAMALQLCEILDYLHTRQPPVIFRDLKPANVMRTAQGHLYLIDFGIARHFKPGQSRDTIAFGSPGYAAPEQYGRAQTTPRADIYSLGALLHFLLTGDDPSLAPFHFAPLDLAGQVGEQPLNELIQRMVALDERQRPASIKEVETELKRIQDLQEQEIALRGLRPLKPAPGGSPRKPQSQGPSHHQTSHKGSQASRTGQQQAQVSEPPHGQLQVQIQTPPPGKRKHTRRRFLIAAIVLGGLVVGGGTLLASHNNAPDTGDNPATVDVVYWSPDGTYVAFCMSNGEVRLLDAKSSTFLYTFTLFNDKNSIVEFLSWAPDSKQLAVCYDDGLPVRIWDVERRKVVLTYPAGADQPAGFTLSPSASSLVWSPDGQSLAWGGANGVSIWSTAGPNNLGAISFPALEGQGNTGDVDALSWAGDSRRLAVALNDSTTNDVKKIQLIDVKSQQSINSPPLPAGPNKAVSMAWAPTGDYIAVVKDVTLSLLYATDTRKNIQVQQTFQDVTALAWSPDAQFLALASYSGYWIYDMQRRQVFSYDSGQYVGLTWLPTGKIAIVSETGRVQILTVILDGPQATPTAR